MHRSQATALLVATLAPAGCGGALPPHVYTEIQFTDVADIALSGAGSGSSAGETIIPAGSAATDATLAEDRADLGNGTSTSYVVHARREDNGGLAVDWDTKLALSSGERAAIVAPETRVIVEVPASEVVSAEQLAAPTLALHWCTAVAYHAGFRGATGTYAIEPRGCISSAPRSGLVAPYTLETPWRNVRIVEHRRPARDAAEMLIACSTLAFGGFAALMFSFPSHDFEGGAPTKYTLAISDVLIMLAFDLPMLPVLWQKDRDVEIGPR